MELCVRERRGRVSINSEDGRGQPPPVVRPCLQFVRGEDLKVVCPLHIQIQAKQPCKSI